ncbi:MAG: SpoIIE family protein phosphatase [Planctomycetota bacterium]
MVDSVARSRNGRAGDADHLLRFRERGMDSPSQILLFEADSVRAEELRARLDSRGITLVCRELQAWAENEAWNPLDIAVIVPGDTAESAASRHLASLLEQLIGKKIATLVWGTPDNVRWAGGPMVDWIDPADSLDEVVGRLCTLNHYVPLIRRFERELDHLHRLGDQLNRYFSEIDQEMRLAGRLQRDFLPRELPELPDLSFATIYRPASWVSGDMYDVFRIDENHLGLFVADAMGHGVAAGLLTMFMRHALVTKVVEGSSYSIVSPAQVLGNLHECLMRQKLPSCQFVTAAYAILETDTRVLRLSRAGHPYPLHITANGTIHELNPGGGLLGLADVKPDFEEALIGLEPGDRVIFFTDGLEEDFFITPENPSDYHEHTDLLRNLARCNIEEFMSSLSDYLDQKAGSLHPMDDVTVLGVELSSQLSPSPQTQM